jgi:hypothetical protein
MHGIYTATTSPMSFCWICNVSSRLDIQGSCQLPGWGSSHCHAINNAMSALHYQGLPELMDESLSMKWHLPVVIALRRWLERGLHSKLTCVRFWSIHPVNRSQTAWSPLRLVAIDIPWRLLLRFTKSLLAFLTAHLAKRAKTVGRSTDIIVISGVQGAVIAVIKQRVPP